MGGSYQSGPGNQPEPLDLEDEAALKEEIVKQLRTFQPRSARTRVVEALRATSVATPKGATCHTIAVALGISDRMVSYILRDLATEGRLKMGEVMAASISGRRYKANVYWVED